MIGMNNDLVDVAMLRLVRWLQVCKTVRALVRDDADNLPSQIRNYSPHRSIANPFQVFTHPFIGYAVFRHFAMRKDQLSHPRNIVRSGVSDDVFLVSRHRISISEWRRICSGLPQFFLNTQKLIVFGHTIRPRK